MSFQFSSTFSNGSSNEQHKAASLLNMSKNATLIDIHNKGNQDLYKLLSQCSLSKSANIPMLVVKSFKPSNKTVESLPKVSNGIKIFTHSSVNSKQIEVHRGMTINAIFCREKWLYIKTAQNEYGYVPIDTCKPVGRRDLSDSDTDEGNCAPLPLTAELINSNRICDATNVSLLEVSKQQNNNNNEFDDQENISELEFSVCGDNNNQATIDRNNMLMQSNENSNLDYIRLFKIKHYLKSLEYEQNATSTTAASTANINDVAFITNTNVYASSSSLSTTASLTNLIKQHQSQLAIDSGFSDTESNTNLRQSRVMSHSYELLSNCTKRRGIKTNGSICSISPNPINIHSTSSSDNEQIEREQPKIIQHKQQQTTIAPPRPQKPEIEIANYKIKTNLSTIIEQSYNTTLSMTKINNESACETARATQSKSNSLISMVSKLDHDISRLNIQNDDEPQQAEVESNMRLVIDNYEAMFVEDLSVDKGDYVTVLEDNNNDWCYAIGKNGKGYIPKSCIQ